MMNFISVNGTLTESENAVVSVQDRGFRYGDGVFETIAVYGGVPYQFDFHMERLRGGLSALKIAYDTATLQQQVHELLKANKAGYAILRIEITRGIGSKGYLPDLSVPRAGSTCIIETSPRPLPVDDWVSLWLSGYQKPSPLVLPTSFKLCQGVNSTLARMQAVENGCFDALQLGESGYICETSSANIFWLKDGILYTPAIGGGTLPGSTRAAIMRLYPYPLQEVLVGVSELAQAQAVCVTNSTWLAVGIASLQPKNMTWESAELAAQLRGLLQKDIEEHCRTQQALWS